MGKKAQLPRALLSSPLPGGLCKTGSQPGPGGQDHPSTCWAQLQRERLHNTWDGTGVAETTLALLMNLCSDKRAGLVWEEAWKLPWLFIQEKVVSPDKEATLQARYRGQIFFVHSPGKWLAWLEKRLLPGLESLLPPLEGLAFNSGFSAVFSFSWEASSAGAGGGVVQSKSKVDALSEKTKLYVPALYIHNNLMR